MITVTLLAPMDSDKESIIIELDPDWFLETDPPFTAIQQFIPEREKDAELDEVLAFAYFLARHYDSEGVERNSKNLCYDAIEALRILNTDPEW